MNLCDNIDTVDSTNPGLSMFSMAKRIVLHRDVVEVALTEGISSGFLE